MKYSILIILLVFSRVFTFAQSDTISHRHLLLKIAPLTYLGAHAAIQLGLETNISTRTTIAFDYAYGNPNISLAGTKGTYDEGEISQRYRLEFRRYTKPFALRNKGINSFYGLELFNRTNTYPSTTTIGRGGNSWNNDYKYYEKLSDDTIYKVWGAYGKIGVMGQISERFWLEWYGGIGMATHTNTTGKYTLAPNDHVFTENGRPKTIYFNFHNPLNFKLTGVDFLWSLKLSYQIL